MIFETHLGELRMYYIPPHGAQESGPFGRRQDMLGMPYEGFPIHLAVGEPYDTDRDERLMEGSKWLKIDHPACGADMKAKVEAFFLEKSRISPKFKHFDPETQPVEITAAERAEFEQLKKQERDREKMQKVRDARAAKKEATG